MVTVSSRWVHRKLTVTTVVTAPGLNDHGSVTARLGHSSITAITAQSRLGHSSITAQVTAQSRLAVTILVTMSSPWTHRELTVSPLWAHGEQSRWPIFFSWVAAVMLLTEYRPNPFIFLRAVLTIFPMGYCNMRFSFWSRVLSTAQ